MKWGFLPTWAKDPNDTFKYKTFNARAEDIFEKPTWRSAIRHTRCLIPANGFYEWQALKDGKQPYFIHPKDQQLFAFAGIYNIWKNDQGEELDTYSIITTSPNKEMSEIHNRMPVILHPKNEKQWLDTSNDTPESIVDLLKPYDNGLLEMYKVSRDVNTGRVDNENLIHPL
jgi:putative SOS response-associated peptidase YedK